jgi:hypothetical protein
MNSPDQQARSAAAQRALEEQRRRASEIQDAAQRAAESHGAAEKDVAAEIPHVLALLESLNWPDMKEIAVRSGRFRTKRLMAASLGNFTPVSSSVDPDARVIPTSTWAHLLADGRLAIGIDFDVARIVEPGQWAARFASAVTELRRRLELQLKAMERAEQCRTTTMMLRQQATASLQNDIGDPADHEAQVTVTMAKIAAAAIRRAGIAADFISPQAIDGRRFDGWIVGAMEQSTIREWRKVKPQLVTFHGGVSWTPDTEQVRRSFFSGVLLNWDGELRRFHGLESQLPPKGTGTRQSLDNLSTTEYERPKLTHQTSLQDQTKAESSVQQAIAELIVLKGIQLQ